MISELTVIAETYPSFFVMLHLFAMVLVLGGATYSDLLLMYFLDDLKISRKEAGIIKRMAQVILIGIVLAFLSGVMLFLPKPELLLETPKFLAKCVIFSVAVINGYVLHHVILPKLINFSFLKEVYLIKKFNLRQAGFVAGAVSVVCWYSIFLLGSFRNNPFSFQQLMIVYVTVLVLAVCSALIIEKTVKKLCAKKISKASKK